MKMPAKVRFKELLGRLSGFSIPIFGVGWKPPQSQREVVRSLVSFLEDRRVLFYPEHMEYGPWVEQSILDIRSELTNTLKDCPEKDQLLGPLRAMRAACRKLLDATSNKGRPQRWMHLDGPVMWEALGELRGVFGTQLAILCASYGVDVPGELVPILPAEDEDSQKTRKKKKEKKAK